MYWKQLFKLVAASTLVGGAAFAQSTKPLPTFNLERFPINVSGNSDLALQGGTINPEGSLRFSAFGEIADEALINRDADGFKSYNLTRKLLWLEGTYAANHWLQVSLQVPFVLYQNGLTELRSNGFAGPDLNGVATPYLGARVAILHQEDGMPLNLAADVRIGLPLGGNTNNFGRDLRVPILPTLSASHDFGAWRLNGQVQGTFRSQSTMEIVSTNKEDTFDHELGVGLGVSGTPAAGVPLRLEASGLLNVALKNSGTSLQTFAGARYGVSKTAEIFLGGGPAFGGLIGTPQFLVMGGVTFTGGSSGSSSHVVEAPVADTVVTKAVCVAGQPHKLTDCPDLDDDNDSVANGVDKCPYETGLKELDGCPKRIVDTDGDGVVDEQDKCPKDKGVLAHDGCPFVDSDKDGIADADDKCPTEVGDAAHNGCAAPKIVDTDGDGVPDDTDNCVKEVGTKDNHGCPAKQKQLVVITKNDLQILDKVYFSSAGYRLQKRSNRLLNQIAEIIKTHPNLPVLEVQGHTDDRGSATKNLVLSQKRADAVRQYLIAHGVDASRVHSKGYGASRPIETNLTAAGREANRRVEFKFVNPTPAAPAAQTNTSAVPSKK